MLLQELLQDIQTMFAHLRSVFLPNLIRAVFVLAAGWLAAVLLRRLTALLVRLFGFDVFAERIGLTRVGEEGRLYYRPSQLAGMLVYGFVLLSSILIALDTLGLEAATVLLGSLIDSLPRLAVALVMLIVGVLVLDFVVKVMEGIKIPGLPGMSAWLPWIVRTALITLILLAILEQLGVAAGLVSIGFAILAGSTALTVVLAFGLGGRSFVDNLLAGFSLRLHLRPGSTVTSAHHEGTIRQIGLSLAELETANGRKLVPNAELLGAALFVQDQNDESRDKPLERGV